MALWPEEIHPVQRITTRWLCLIRKYSSIHRSRRHDALLKLMVKYNLTIFMPERCEAKKCKKKLLHALDVPRGNLINRI